MQPQVASAELNLELLRGAVISAYAQDSGYWHCFVAFRTGETSLIFTTQAHYVAERFEVFPICVANDSLPRQWQEHQPVCIAAVFPLWRTEWIDAGTCGPTLGSPPGNTQYSGRGPAGAAALCTAKVLAGVLLVGATNERIIVAASNSAPCNVELFRGVEAVVQALRGFEPVSPNHSIEATS